METDGALSLSGVQKRERDPFSSLLSFLSLSLFYFSFSSPRTELRRDMTGKGKGGGRRERGSLFVRRSHERILGDLGMAPPSFALSR